ncbi:hypothetical protein Tco_0543459, partial [Tanacetum coccineum]
TSIRRIRSIPYDVLIVWTLSGTGYSLKDKNVAKNDKTEHGMEKLGKDKVNPEKSTVKTGADTEEYLMGKPEPI